MAEREERLVMPRAGDEIGTVVEKPLSAWERMYGRSWVRKIIVLVFLAVLWEVYARWLNNPLLFPTFGATVKAFADGIMTGGLPGRAWYSLRILVMGYAVGI